MEHEKKKSLPTLQSMSYRKLMVDDLYPVQNIEVGKKYKVLNYDGRNFDDLGECTANRYYPKQYPTFHNDGQGHPEYRYLKFENDNYPSKPDIIEMIEENPLNAKIPIYPEEEEEEKPRSSVLNEVVKQSFSEEEKPRSSVLSEVVKQSFSEEEKPRSSVLSGKDNRKKILETIKGMYVQNDDNDNFIVQSYYNSNTKDDFLKITFPLGVNKYVLVYKFFNSDGSKITFGGSSANKYNKRKTNKRKTNKRKTNKRKTNKQKTNKRKTNK